MRLGLWIYLIAVIIYGVFGVISVAFNYAYWILKAKYEYEKKSFMLLAIIPISVATPILIIGAVCGALL